MQAKDISDEQVVAACHAFHEELGDSSIARLVAATGAPEKVCLRAMERADRRGLIDWGTTIRGAWPTEAGYALAGQQPPPARPAAETWTRRVQEWADIASGEKE